jgi:hypothetical protein
MRLTDDRYRKLSDLGFVWDAQERSSEKSSSALSNKSSDKQRRGSCPSGTVDDREPHLHIPGEKHTRDLNPQSHFPGEDHSRDRNPPSHFPGENHTLDPTRRAICVNTIEAALNSKVLADPEGVLQAARINSWRLQMSGLAPTGEVGATRILSPNELMTLPVTTTLAFVPVLRTGPALHLTAPPYDGMAEMHAEMERAATRPSMPEAILGQGFHPHPPSERNIILSETLPDHLIQVQEAYMQNSRNGPARGVRDRIIRDADIDERLGRGGGRRADPPEN